MDVTDTTSVESSAEQERKNDPVWTTEAHRVKGAMWKHVQDNGKARFTIAVYRSYKNDDTKKWVNTHYFDEQDLGDVRQVCAEAEEKLLQLKGMTQATGQD